MSLSHPAKSPTQESLPLPPFHPPQSRRPQRKRILSLLIYLVLLVDVQGVRSLACADSWLPSLIMLRVWSSQNDLKCTQTKTFAIITYEQYDWSAKTILDPGSSGPSAVQHLDKLQDTLVAEGHLIPPALGKVTEADPAWLRGYARDHTKQTPTATQHPKVNLVILGIIKGSDNYWDKAIMLCVQYECHKAGIRIPWDKAVHRLNPGSSGPSAVQQLDKLRDTSVARSLKQDNRGSWKKRGTRTPLFKHNVDGHADPAELSSLLKMSTTQARRRVARREALALLGRGQSCSMKTNQFGTPTPRQTALDISAIRLAFASHGTRWLSNLTTEQATSGSKAEGAEPQKGDKSNNRSGPKDDNTIYAKLKSEKKAKHLIQDVVDSLPVQVSELQNWNNAVTSIPEFATGKPTLLSPLTHYILRFLYTAELHHSAKPSQGAGHKYGHQRWRVERLESNADGASNFLLSWCLSTAAETSCVHNLYWAHLARGFYRLYLMPLIIDSTLAKRPSRGLGLAISKAQFRKKRMHTKSSGPYNTSSYPTEPLGLCFTTADASYQMNSFKQNESHTYLLVPSSLILSSAISQLVEEHVCYYNLPARREATVLALHEHSIHLSRAKAAPAGHNCEHSPTRETRRRLHEPFTGVFTDASG
ncbi:hypothetical protein MBM_05628 [Drepanopeziza brunnea f. sp. 'multigermtubi' MB_m1]|uniref:Uncharacterized protein n=1 Tax=Marssonina brunnea f. sp. multigermtubi (strain MB_m1) TaxID=1072389 RepID=K1XUF5_MARBU|nr:uncharacterized protein MBM_05628 [Drepanopeziza brunnea f. sp. 'multigermtubi' MB_m1]EKD16334.1 hypothetical protein MBM_05628 [Drepanopeziza brunnea f. sp. 'multigermtubi' MB_m1]